MAIVALLVIMNSFSVTGISCEYHINLEIREKFVGVLRADGFQTIGNGAFWKLAEDSFMLSLWDPPAVYCCWSIDQRHTCTTKLYTIFLL